MASPSKGPPVAPFIVFGVVATLCSLPFLAELGNFRVHSEMADLLAGDQRSLSNYQGANDLIVDADLLNDAHGGEDVGVLISMEADDVFSPEALRTLDAISSELLTEVGVGHVVSLASPRLRPKFYQMGEWDLWRGKFPQLSTPVFVPLVPGVPDAIPDASRLKEIKEWTVQFPFYRNLFVDEEARHAMLLVFSRRHFLSSTDKQAFCRGIDTVLDGFRKKGWKLRVLSFPHAETETMANLEGDIERMLPAMSVVLLVVLLAAFRFSPALVCFVLLMQVAGVALALGLVPALGFRISPFTVPLFPLLTGIHLTLLIHIGTAFQAARRSGLGVELAMSAMLGQVLKACAFAALTTTVGLLTLSFSEVRPTAVFGQLGACGIVAMFVLTFGPGMALLRVLGQLTVAGNPWEQSQKVTWPTALVDGVMRWRSMILLASAVVIVAVCFGWSRVRTDIRIVEFLSPKSETRLAMEGLDRDYGGINFAKIEINTGRENGVLRRECFSLLNRMEQFALKQDAGVSMGYSAAMLVRAADGLLRKDIPWVGNVPSGLRARFIMQAFQQPEVKRDTPLLGFLYDENLQRAYLMLRMRDLPSDRYLKLLDDVVKEGQAHAPKDWQVTAVDSKAAILEADRRIVDSQRDSAMWTVGIIGILLAILWRSPGLALLALAANAIPVGLVVAVQGLAGVPLNSVTIMVAAIAFGIAVDDAIHFITHWRDERRRGVRSREAVLNTLRVKGRPIVCTTIILVGIMCVFFLASFPPAVAFGWLSAIGFAGALVAALGLLPIALARDE